MNSIDFCYWMQGYFEISGDEALTTGQAKIVKDHLNLVFKHEIDPLREKQTTVSAEELNKVHNSHLKGNDVLVRC